MLMCLVNKRFQIFGRTKARRSSEKRTYMIAKTSIIRMFLYSHYLYAIISIFDDTRQNKFFKFGVSTHFFGILPHTNMAFVNEQWRSIRFKLLLRPRISFFGLPHLSRKDMGLFVLHHTASPCRDTFTASTIPMHMHFIELAMGYSLFRKA